MVKHRRVRRAMAAHMVAALAVVASLAWAAPTAAQQEHEHDVSPYAGQEARDIKALDPDRVAGLLAGEGLGYAKAAELNGIPGPKHVMELTEALELTGEQRSATEAIFQRMHEAAVELGARIVEAERALDRAFADRAVDGGGLFERTAEIGRLEGELRAVHLRAHLEMLEVLTRHQVHLYGELRGYATEHVHGG